jgi:hypothetical protein
MKRHFAVVLILCMAASAFAQGMYWQTKTEGTVSEKTSDYFAVPKKFKMAEVGDEDAIIVRLDKQVMWTINAKKKTYQEMTFDDLEKMMNKAGNKMDAAMEKMQKELADMPPEQRKMVEGMMKDKMPGMGARADKPIDVHRKGDKRTISGYGCTKYVMTRGDEEFTTLWVTKDVKGFDALMADWKEFSRRMAAMAQRFAKGSGEAYKKIDGFPIETVTKIMNNTVTTTVTKIESRSIAASEFELPAGYTKVKSQMEEAMEKMDNEEE